MEDIIWTFIEYLCPQNTIDYLEADNKFYWIDYEKKFKRNKIKDTDIHNALVCKFEKNGKFYDLKTKKCIPKKKGEDYYTYLTG